MNKITATQLEVLTTQKTNTMKINTEKLFDVMGDITKEQYDNLLEGETLTLHTTEGVEISMYKYDHNYQTMGLYEDDEEEQDPPIHCVIQYNGDDIFVVQTNEDYLGFTDIYGL